MQLHHRKIFCRSSVAAISKSTLTTGWDEHYPSHQHPFLQSHLFSNSNCPSRDIYFTVVERPRSQNVWTSHNSLDQNDRASRKQGKLVRLSEAIPAWWLPSSWIMTGWAWPKTKTTPFGAWLGRTRSMSSSGAGLIPISCVSTLYGMGAFITIAPKQSIGYIQLISCACHPRESSRWKRREYIGCNTASNIERGSFFPTTIIFVRLTLNVVGHAEK